MDKKKIHKGGASPDNALKLVRLLNRHLMEGVSVNTLALESGKSERTIWRLLGIYKKEGLEGLARKHRSDKGYRKIPDKLKTVIEGMCFRKPGTSLAWIHKKVEEYCKKEEIQAPSYGTIRNIYQSLHPHMKVLAHDGDKAYKQAFEIIHRMEADRPNEFWQCDHKQLDVFCSDYRGKTGKLWIAAIIDDYSRAIPGYYLGIEPPNSMRVAISLRQGIWYKSEPGWIACGIPEHFYSDHGPDFKSTHMEQVAADLKFQLHNSVVEEPQGRGKIERFFRTVNSMFIPDILNWPSKNLQVEQIDKAFRRWLVEEYHQKKHSETDELPSQRFREGTFIPRMPESLEAIDVEIEAVTGLVTVARKADQQQAIEDGLIALANLDYEIKAYEETVAHLNELIPMIKQNRGIKFPGLIRAYQLLGSSYLNLGKIQEAKDALMLALNLENSTKGLGYEASIGLAHAHIGALLVGQGQFRRALTHLKTAQTYKLNLPKNTMMDSIQIELSHYPIQELIGTSKLCEHK